MIFNVGARRSGTYWLQRITCAHPAVAEVPVRDVRLLARDCAAAGALPARRPRPIEEVGQVYADRDARHRVGAIRSLCDTVFGEFMRDPARRTSPSARRGTSYHLPLIAEVYPDARFVHIVRDGRDASAVARRTAWGPTTVKEAAEEWRSSVAAGRAAAPALGERLLEVRYEDLLADPEPAIPRIYAHDGLEGAVDEALAGCRRQGEHRPPGQPGRRGQVARGLGPPRAARLRPGGGRPAARARLRPGPEACRRGSRRPRTAPRAATGRSCRPRVRARARCRAGTARSQPRSRPPPPEWRRRSGPRSAAGADAGCRCGSSSACRVSSRRRGRRTCLRLRDRPRGRLAARRDRARPRRLRPLRVGRVGDAAEGLPGRAAGRRLPRDAGEGRRAGDPEVGHVVPRATRRAACRW